MPCLIEKITDTTTMPDPRYSVPHVQYYVVGDTAVFILLRILSRDDTEWKKLMIGSLPPKYADEWETNGVYAYFNYVSDPRNRTQLKNWWKKWLTENRK